MATYDLIIGDISYLSTTAPGFDDNAGDQFTWNTDTITIDPLVVTQTIQVDDTDGTFDDDAAHQVLVNADTINGTFYPAGTVIEAEYLVELTDGTTTYRMQIVSLRNDAFTAHAFTMIGDVPPFGTPLTVTQTYDNVQGTVPYSATLPACFGATTRLATRHDPVQAGHLRRGDHLLLAGGGEAEVRLVIRQRIDVFAHPHMAPVRVQSRALGRNMPERALWLSPQHRVFVPWLAALVPACALRVLPRVGPARRLLSVDYIHVVCARHELLLAEGLICESFWPGAQAMEGLSDAERQRVRRIMGPNPQPAAPMLRRREAELALGRAGIMLRAGPLAG